MTDQGLFHIGISEPKRIRKELLEATRATVSCLQRYEKFNGVREDKQIVMDEFVNIIKEIYGLDAKLNQILPKTGIKTKKTKLIKKMKKTKKKEIKKKEAHETRLSELEALEKDLAKIDSALSKLK